MSSTSGVTTGASCLAPIQIAASVSRVEKAKLRYPRNCSAPQVLRFWLGLQAIGPSLSMLGHYKKRCGESKATANGFLMNLIS